MGISYKTTTPFLRTKIELVGNNDLRWSVFIKSHSFVYISTHVNQMTPKESQIFVDGYLFSLVYMPWEQEEADVVFTDTLS